MLLDRHLQPRSTLVSDSAGKLRKDLGRKSKEGCHCMGRNVDGEIRTSVGTAPKVRPGEEDGEEGVGIEIGLVCGRAIIAACQRMKTILLAWDACS